MTTMVVTTTITCLNITEINIDPPDVLDANPDINVGRPDIDHESPENDDVPPNVPTRAPGVIPTIHPAIRTARQ